MRRAQHRRGRPWWRSRRLIAAVLIVDLLGVAALALALTRNQDNSSTATSGTAASALISTPPSAPRTGTQAAPLAAPKRKKHVTAPAPVSRSVREPEQQAGAQESFARLASTMPGAVGLAIAPLGAGPLRTFGVLQVGHAWSTMKVPVLTAVLSEMEHSGQVFNSQGRDYATRAIERSDNSAAEALFSGLEQTHGGLIGASAAVQDTLRAAGDTVTSINTEPNSSGFTTWGQSEWSASGEVTFYRSLARGCLLSPSGTVYVLNLMQNVDPNQRWGAGSAPFPATLPVALKGGWGPENGSGYLVRQTAIVGSGNHGVVISTLARPSNGAFSTGAQMLTQLAAWAARTFAITASHSSATCG